MGRNCSLLYKYTLTGWTQKRARNCFYLLAIHHGNIHLLEVGSMGIFIHSKRYDLHLQHYHDHRMVLFQHPQRPKLPLRLLPLLGTQRFNKATRYGKIKDGYYELYGSIKGRFDNPWRRWFKADISICG